MTDSANTGTYSENRSQDNFPDGIQDLYWNRARNLFFERLFRKHVPFPGRILEVGCGRGVVLDFFRKRGYDAWGFEPGEVPPLRQVAPFVFSRPSLTDLPAEFTRTVRSVLVLDVIEHIPQPIEFLSTLIKAFPTLETLMLSVPAGPELWSNYDDHFGHLRRYLPQDLRTLASELGINPGPLGFCFHLLYPLMRLHGWLGLKREVHLQSPRGLARLFHAALGMMMFAESILLPPELPGSSLYLFLRCGHPRSSLPD